MVEELTPHQRHDRMTSIFGEAMSLSGPDRSLFLDRACGDDGEMRSAVERLLEEDDGSDDFLVEPALGSDFRLPEVTTSFHSGADLVGQRVGRYTLERPIASGGMGLVFEARQHKPDRTVAIKILRRGLADDRSLRRFEFEAEVLGRLRHPGIAQVYESGLFELAGSRRGLPVTVPYFAMEYVPDARPITEFARSRGLSVEDRLNLMIATCDAVHHGHQQGIIHRDLKPANILVDPEGRPKIIDFGVARALDPTARVTMDTAAGRVIGTLMYMSPEQVGTDDTRIDTRADVYSLGTVLYEVLSGRVPIDIRGRSLVESARLIEESTPARLDLPDRVFAADLETVVAKTLAKRPEDRYESAAALAADLRRVLRHQPIEARPPSAVYQMKKFARRNRAMCVAAPFVVLSLVAATIVGSGWAKEAERVESEASEISRSLLEVILTAEPSGDGYRVSLPRLRKLVEDGGISDPGIEAQLLTVVARMSRRGARQDLRDSERFLHRALDLSREAHGDVSREGLEIQKQLATTYLQWARLDDALEAVRDAEAMAEALYGVGHWATHPDDHLYTLTLNSMVDQAARQRKRTEIRALRGEMPLIEDIEALAGVPVAPLQLVLLEEFDSSSIGERWDVELRDVSSWEHAIEASRLVVAGISSSNPRERSGGRSSRVRLQRAVEKIGDFRLTARIGWHSLGEVSAVQSVHVGLVDVDGRWIVSCGMLDPSSAWQGEVEASIEGFSVARGGVDSLPDRGEATVEIERVGVDVTFQWDGRPIAIGRARSLADTVTIDFGCYAATIRGRQTSFGRLWIDSIRLEGVPVAER